MYVLLDSLIIACAVIAQHPELGGVFGQIRVSRWDKSLGKDG